MRGRSAPQAINDSMPPVEQIRVLRRDIEQLWDIRRDLENHVATAEIHRSGRVVATSMTKGYLAKYNGNGIMVDSVIREDGEIVSVDGNVDVGDHEIICREGDAYGDPYISSKMDASGFEVTLKRAEMTHEEASDAWFIDHFYSQGSLARGDYEACLRNWLSIYPKEQLLILSLETIAANPVEMANRCLTHIGVSPIFTPDDRERLSIKIFQGDQMPLRPSLAPVLDKIYKEKIKRMSEYLSEI